MISPERAEPSFPEAVESALSNIAKSRPSDWLVKHNTYLKTVSANMRKRQMHTMHIGRRGA
jgi:L,D-peptidoglycan transpeptidase YkuD (ErfK/YbiS/YcfS/YnhG family)